MFSSRSILAVLALLLSAGVIAAFSPNPALAAPRASTVVDAPTRKGADRRTGGDAPEKYDGNYDEAALVEAARKGGPLEYLEDDPNVNRDDEEPFHILLMGTTFDKPKITLGYVAGSLTYVLDMPELDAIDHANFSQVQGMSCLGTWSRKECLSLGKQLQVRDLVCRVVPFCEGSQQPWQAKDVSGAGALGGGSVLE